MHIGRNLPLDAPGHDDIANVGFIVGKRCVAVIDSGGSLRIGRALRAALRDRTRLPVCYVINTHVHVDHVLGNVAFRDDQPHFVGHARLAAALARSRDFFLQNYAADFDAPADAAQIIAPDLTVAPGQELHLDLGERELHPAGVAAGAYRLRPHGVRCDHGRPCGRVTSCSWAARRRSTAASRAGWRSAPSSPG